MFNPMNSYMPLRAIGPAASKGINWASILTNTQKTLNIVNQAIPLVYQVKPIINNARTMFKVASAFSSSNNNSSNKVSSNTNSYNSQDENIQSYNYDENGPSFFI